MKPERCAMSYNVEQSLRASHQTEWVSERRLGKSSSRRKSNFRALWVRGRGEEGTGSGPCEPR